MWIIVLICAIPFLGFIYWQLVQRIGLQQEEDWKQFKKENSHLFPKPLPPAAAPVHEDIQKKSTLTKCGEDTSQNTRPPLKGGIEHE